MSNAIGYAVWPAYRVETKSETSGGRELGQAEFLKILIAQLRNQDPTQPLQDRDFIAQMAQLTAVERLTRMEEEIRLLRQAVGLPGELLGKRIEWEPDADSGRGQPQRKTGVVDAIGVDAGIPYVSVGGERVELDRIRKVWSSP